MVIFTRNAPETELLGECLGRVLESGDVVTLSGDLGAGKTRFAQGVASGLGVDRAHPVTSPTYTILNEHQGLLPLYHFDFYRFGTGADLRDLGFEEYVAGVGVCLVEWPERLVGGFAEEYVEICIDVMGDETRKITVTHHGVAYERKIASFCAVVKKCFDRNFDSCY
jgi:tRNA threonylcarbamoyladenosine biosynthesis protein TsaE